ncbi:MAG: Rid family detoxifying hydrolase [Acidobacteriota bacterium]|nr:Rid family detoxifying hydrolase [Acidobacteriota bacterium]
MYRVTLNSDTAPAAVGPYSQAVRVSGELLFISGQVALDAASGELVGTSAAEQARKCLENLHAIATDAGSSLEDAVKITVYLTDIAAYPEVNEVYAGFFKHDPPARVALAVAALPKGAQVEIDAVIAVGA